MRDRETSHEIDAQAAEWAARVDRAPLSDDEQVELDAWTAADVRHLGAFAKARAVFAHARRARALGPGFDPGAFAADEPVDTESTRLERARRRRFLGLGGAGALVAAGAVFARWTWSETESVVRTERGEIRLLPLPDGSAVTLNTASTIKVLINAERRLVRLIAGEALFDVAKDAARAFVVEAADTTVRAIGASFTVRNLADHAVQVLVREGVVEVARRGLSVEPLRVVANMRATAVGADTIEAAPVSPPQVTRELAWREGMLSFEDVRLDQAAAEFARYNDTRIIIEDPAVAAQTVTGLFAARNPAGFASAAAAALDLEAQAAADGVRLRRRSSL